MKAQADAFSRQNKYYTAVIYSRSLVEYGAPLHLATILPVHNLP